MKTTLITALFSLTSITAYSQGICNFNKAEIPRNEKRLLELARVVEYRCDYVIPQTLIKYSYKGNKFMNDTQFLVERYQEGKCVSRKWISLAKQSKAIEDKYKGIISFGWHMDNQKLVGVNDTGFWHQSGFVDLPNFAASRPAASFFKNSKAEPRTCARGSKFNLYPIIGLSGDKLKTHGGLTLSPPRIRTSKFTSSELVNHYKRKEDSVIVYLYFGTGTRDLDYNKKM